MTHSNAPSGSETRTRSHGSSCSHAHRSMPTWRRLPPLPRRTRTLPRERSRSLSASASASLMRRPARHSTTMSARVLRLCSVSPATRMTATISSTAGGSRDTADPCYAADGRSGSRAWSPESGTTACGVEQDGIGHVPSVPRHRTCRDPSGYRSSSKAVVAWFVWRAAACASRRQRWRSTSIRSAAHARPHCAYAPDATRPAKWRFRGSSPSEHQWRRRTTCGCWRCAPQPPPGGWSCPV